jgi:hypothetical protein
MNDTFKTPKIKFLLRELARSHASAEAQGNVVRAICLSKVNPHF